jgi:hypothetical protein
MSTSQITSGSSTQLPKLTGANYHSWRNEILIALAGINARRLVIGEEAAPANNSAVAAVRDFAERREKAASMLHHACGPEAKSFIIGEFDPIRIWQELNNRFANAATSESRLQLVMRFNSLAMKPSGTAGEWIAELRQIQNQLALSDDAISDRQMVTHILAKLPPKFSTLRQIITHSANPADQTLESVSRNIHLFEEQEKLKNQLSGNLDSASTLTNANALYAGGNRHRNSHGNNRHHRNPKNRQNSSDRPKRKAGKDDVCYYCTKKGHFSSDCRTRIQAEKMGQERKERKNNYRKQNGQGGQGGGGRQHNANDKNSAHANLASASHPTDQQLENSNQSAVDPSLNANSFHSAAFFAQYDSEPPTDVFESSLADH